MRFFVVIYLLFAVYHTNTATSQNSLEDSLIGNRWYRYGSIEFNLEDSICFCKNKNYKKCGINYIGAAESYLFKKRGKAYFWSEVKGSTYGYKDSTEYVKWKLKNRGLYFTHLHKPMGKQETDEKVIEAIEKIYGKIDRRRPGSVKTKTWMLKYGPLNIIYIDNDLLIYSVGTRGDSFGYGVFVSQADFTKVDKNRVNAFLSSLVCNNKFQDN